MRGGRGLLRDDHAVPGEDRQDAGAAGDDRRRIVGAGGRGAKADAAKSAAANTSVNAGIRPGICKSFVISGASSEVSTED